VSDETPTPEPAPSPAPDPAGGIRQPTPSPHEATTVTDMPAPTAPAAPPSNEPTPPAARADAPTTVGAPGAPSATTPAQPVKVQKVVAVPMWLLVTIAGLIGAVVMFGLGYAIGDSGDDRAAPQPRFGVPGNPFRGGDRLFPDLFDRRQRPGRPDIPGVPGRSRAFLGVATRAVDGGVEITQVVSGSAAADAGLRVGDVITAFDGDSVSTPTELARAVADHDPGDEVRITYRRNGQSQTVTIKLASRDATSSS
jgi:membrane-associated protease RseP (regulator of RpoE activity)